MLKLDIEVNDQAIRQAFQAILARRKNLQPAFKAIGETLVESTKRRFGTSTGPDGQKWAPNTDTTLQRYLGNFKNSYTKKGNLSKRGKKRLGNKKPLIGETRQLSTQLHYQASATELRIGSSMIYAATHQFGATKGEFSQATATVKEYTRRSGVKVRAHTLKVSVPWGNIPARPFLGISSGDKDAILEILGNHLIGSSK